MFKSARVVATVVALSSIAHAESPVVFDAASLPFLDPDAGSLETEVYSFQISGDGSTVFGTVRERFADEGAPYSVRFEYTPWRWNRLTGFEVLDLSPIETPGASFNFGPATSDGGVVQVFAQSDFGTAQGVLTPDGVVSHRDFTDDAVWSISAISADGSTVVGGGRAFTKWSASEGERRFFAPLAPGISAADDFGGAIRLSDDGSKTVGYSASASAQNGIAWIHDESDGFTVIESDSGWLSPGFVSSDASVIAGQRILPNDDSTAFLWDAQNGLRDISAPDAEFGAVDAMSGDGKIVAYQSWEFFPELVTDSRLLIDGVGDFEVGEGLALLGYDLTGLNVVSVFDLSADGLTALVSVGDFFGPRETVLLTSTIPAPGALALLALAPIAVSRRRRQP